MRRLTSCSTSSTSSVGVRRSCVTSWRRRCTRSVRAFDAIWESHRASQIVVWEDQFDAQTLLLTPNSETVYGMTYLDLKTDGPTVCEVAPGMLGLVNDMWMREVANIGPAGPDQGRGGRFLFLPPGYDGDLPPYGFHVVRSRDLRRLVSASGYAHAGWKLCRSSGEAPPNQDLPAR